jgi:hypothetical protein
LITQSAGDGFVRRLAQHDIKVYITSEADPSAAVACLAAGKPLPAAAVEHTQHKCNCGHNAAFAAVEQ